MQDLSGFSVPKGFRGGNAIKVQLWWAVQATLFSWSPQVMYRWRAFLLRMFGAKIGKNASHPTFCKNYVSVEIDVR
ncbi:putative colanic acid biosynthesis acetyltransferase WcaF [Citrobacter koseri]|uniref:Putative colanic acid biosynthesis acetyltransferase WcaF n=1 Tax=Citrobacter koseri TaxID=545 RepID=A0A2X2VQJ7_CITKO|nr:putative colanic acid biosynthesis acetyltransferase WcaF [Citrobacter koseri]